MKKDNLYWSLHKSEYEKQFDALDKEIRQTILKDSGGEDSAALDIIVDRAIEEKIKKMIDFH
jgi:hypothetical protein